MKRLYMGLDLGWSGMRFEVRTEKNELVKRGGAPATPKGLCELLKRFKNWAWVQVAYEAGSQMYWVHRVIQEAGMESYPFHAKSFAIIVKSKKKTDKKDAHQIAKNAVKENLPERLVVAEGKEKELRDLLKEREARKKDLIALGNELHALAIAQGFRLKRRGGLSQSVEQWEKEIEQFEGEVKKRVMRLYRQALPIFQVLDEIEEEVQSKGKEGEFGEARRRLEQQPGLGFWTSTALLAWSGVDGARFASTRQAASYFGMVTATRESGDQERLGHITKEGPALVRKLMVQAAWAFIRSKEGRSSKWGRWFLEEVKRRPNQKKVLLIALARKLLTAAIACLRNQTTWDSNVLNKTQIPESKKLA